MWTLEWFGGQWTMPGFFGSLAAIRRAIRRDMMAKKFIGNSQWNHDGKDVQIQILSQAHYDVLMEQVGTLGTYNFLEIY